MNQYEFLEDKEVKGFVEWAGHLVSGDWGMVHKWITQERYGGNFSCSNLYEAYRRYSWDGRSIGQTMDFFDDCRKEFEAVNDIATYDDKHKFLDIAKKIAVDWGGSKALNLNSSRNWGDIAPAQFQQHIGEIRQKLDPAKADTKELPVSLRMGAGFSKIYSALVPGLPIYDSRVACALSCLIRIYQQNEKVNVTGATLSFPVPKTQPRKGKGPNRCAGDSIDHGEYAEANLKCAWLLQGLLDRPGEFANVPEKRRVDALQSALFMLGYTRLREGAVVKPCRKSTAPHRK